jgi:hypothetical protein
MSRRATIFGAGSPGGTIDYRGDVTPPVTSYASAADRTPMLARLGLTSSTIRTRSSVVNRMDRRGGMRFFYVHGGIDMPNALPHPGPGVGGVNSSAFQPTLVQLMDWQINPRWFEAGYPRNLGLSTRVPQLQTNITGGPGRSRQTQRPLFTKVQQVQRARGVVRTYPTRAASS